MKIENTHTSKQNGNFFKKTSLDFLFNAIKNLTIKKRTPFQFIDLIYKFHICSRPFFLVSVFANKVTMHLNRHLD